MSMTMEEINAALEAVTRFARIWLQQSATDGTISTKDIVSCKPLLKKWDAQSTFVFGEFVTYEDGIYRAKSEVSSGVTPNTSSDFWEKIETTSDIVEFNAKSEITTLENQQTATNDAVLGLMSMMTMMN